MLWFLYCYGFSFGRTVEAGPVWLPVLADVCLFSVFALHHSVFARSSMKGLVTRLILPELERSLYTWVASVLFLATCTWWQPIPGVLYQLDGWLRVPGYAVQLVGVVLTIRASSALDALDLAGVRPVILAATGSGPRHIPLNTHGLFAFVRHPLYFAWVLFVFGTPVMTATRAVFAIISTAYLAMAIPWEERSLVETFGKEYEAYRRKVRWRMLPGIY